MVAMVTTVIIEIFVTLVTLITIVTIKSISMLVTLITCIYLTIAIKVHLQGSHTHLQSYKTQYIALIKSFNKYHKGGVIRQSWGLGGRWLGQIVNWGHNTSCALTDNVISHQIKHCTYSMIYNALKIRMLCTYHALQQT